LATGNTAVRFDQQLGPSDIDELGALTRKQHRAPGWVSNNNFTVKFYDIPMRGNATPPDIKHAGTLFLDVAVNHYA
jgi:hypothetical protein